MDIHLRPAIVYALSETVAALSDRTANPLSQYTTIALGPCS